MDPNTDEKSLAVDEALSFATKKTPASGFWKVLTSVWITVYLASVIIWCIAELPFQKEMAPYCHWINIADGGVQHWSLFSPDVRHIIYHESAIVSFKDGTMKLYEFPRMEKMSQWEKFKHEKLRKLFSDCIPWPGYESFLPSVTQYLASSNQNSKNEPAMVTMVFNSVENPAPDPDKWNYRNRLPFHTNKYVTFMYTVRESDLIDESAHNGISQPHRQSTLRIFDE